MSFFNWMVDSMASEDVIDLYFILSDLVDIELTEAEIYESACYDSLATATVRAYDSMAAATVNECQVNSNIPLGKMVL